SNWLERLSIPLTAFSVLVITAVGTFLICRNFPLPMDEYLAVLQAQWLRDGHIFGHLDPEWKPYGFAMTAPLMGYYPDTNSWATSYHPGYAMMRVLTGMVGLEAFTNALLSAACVWLIALAAQRIWPDEQKSSKLAVLFLATSAQFLIYGMTAYSM